MSVICLNTKINAAIETCFDLSRSIELHKISTAHTNEQAIGGVTSGLIGFNEYVTWQAKHFGITQKLTTKITEYKRPFHFRDEQIKGAFSSFKHDHYFSVEAGVVIMKDVFEFQSPYGIFGSIFNRLILTRYMRTLLVRRNEIIREFAENSKEKILFE
ncbi:hypothetical protein BH10BAC3_BH10BAC3_31190 [soil metagenome]